MGPRPRVTICSIAALLLSVPAAGTAHAAAASRAPAARLAVAAGDDYVALGDSYSAGVGAPGMSGLCLRSEQGYPPLWAEEIDAGSFRTVACFGAETDDVRTLQTWALGPSTDVVTLSVGGNDVGFASTMLTCTLASVSSCLDTVDEARRKIRDELPADLERTYAAVRDRAPSAEVLVLGYPRLFEESACPGGPALAKRQALNDAADDLSAATAAAAREAGFRYVDVRGVFAGHGVCGSDPWINRAALSVGAFHPNAAGYRDGYLAALPS